jgi:hypothetical protein
VEAVAVGLLLAAILRREVVVEGYLQQQPRCLLALLTQSRLGLAALVGLVML